MDKIIPVVGKLTHSPLNSIAYTGFYCFESHIGVNGLAKVADDDKTLFFLAVVSDKRGVFSKFIKLLKLHFNKIIFYEIWNEKLFNKLIGLNFKEYRGIDSDTNQLENGLIWQREGID